MHTSLHLSDDLTRAVMLRSHHQRSKKRSKATQRIPRKEAVAGTKSYNDALQRSFNKAKMQIFFNPDMTYFVTFTYKAKKNTVEQVQQDIKIYMKEVRRHVKQPIKYIYIMEYQKRGSIHVHMIANQLPTYRNKNGYQSLKYWRRGFTSVLRITDFDGNFRPYLYLFKYMRKSQRIGKSFVHSSRNLGNYEKYTDTSLQLDQWRTVTMEKTHVELQTPSTKNKKFTFYKNYLVFDDTMATQPLNHHRKKDIEQWLVQVKLHSNKELEKILANRTQHYSLK